MKKNSAFPGSLIWHFEEFPLYTEPQNTFFSTPKKRNMHIYKRAEKLQHKTCFC